MVDATAGHELLSFMDAHLVYNQIKMHLPGEDKTAFITDQGIYCYKVIVFGLNKVGEIFQSMVNKVFKELIGHTMKVYVDDMLVKNLQSADQVLHLSEAFDHL